MDVIFFLNTIHVDLSMNYPPFVIDYVLILPRLDVYGDDWHTVLKGTI